MERYTEEGGNAYEQVQDISTRLALYGRSFWTKDVEKSWQVYRAMKPKRCQTLFMEDFENLKPFEVLELIGIMDWDKYLDKGFDVPVRKGWHT